LFNKGSFTKHFLKLLSLLFDFYVLGVGVEGLVKTPLEQQSARRMDLYQNNTQYSQETDIHERYGIRTRNPNKRAAADRAATGIVFLNLIFTGI
jgi:hypothetical protein